MKTYKFGILNGHVVVKIFIFARILHGHCNVQSVSPRYPNTERWAQLIFFNRFGDVWIPDETLQFFIWLLKPFMNDSWEIQSKSLQNFKLFKSRYPNLCHHVDFLCFSLCELLMSFGSLYEQLKVTVSYLSNKLKSVTK